MEDLWSYLQKQNKPIVLYGMGNGADKILSVFSDKGIECRGVFASAGFARGNYFHGFKVSEYSAIKNELGEFIVLVSFASALPEVISNVKKISEEQELYIPDVPVCGNELFDGDFYIANKNEIAETRSLLVDDFSKFLYDNIVATRLSGRLDGLFDFTSTEDEIMSLLGAENFTSFVDCGAYVGDTVLSLKKYAPKLQNVYAFEPSPTSIRKMTENLSHLSNVKIIHGAVSDRTGTIPFTKGGGRGARGQNKSTVNVPLVRVDDCVNDKTDYIKYDVEGAEAQALSGSADTIKAYEPNMRVALYHRGGDIFRLPQKVHEMLPDHKLYIRRRACMPLWDIDLLAIK